MYKLIVVSDSHRAVCDFRRILPIINSSDYLVFCGDGIFDLISLRGEITVPIVSVRGNCDIMSSIDNVARFMLGETRALVTHGHLYDAKRTLDRLASAARAEHCDVVFFGHTHKFTDTEVGGVRLINPGSLADGSYASVTINGKSIVCDKQYV